jgi:hypothetical protein
VTKHITRNTGIKYFIVQNIKSCVWEIIKSLFSKMQLYVTNEAKTLCDCLMYLIYSFKCFTFLILLKQNLNDTHYAIIMQNVGKYGLSLILRTVVFKYDLRF